MTRFFGSLAIFLAFFLPGCDAAGRHKVLSVVFEGYPSSLPPEELCVDYLAAKAQGGEQNAAGGASKAEGDSSGATLSQHLPYKEKSCSDCHDKSKPGGLVLPARELCFMCHTDFIQGAFVHGPAAVGDCLACHQPHSSNYPSLLVAPQERLCGDCHQERREAERMHRRVAEEEIGCVECHDPHFGDRKYFLK